MKNKLYASFALVAMASAIIALIRIAIGHDAVEAVQPNLVIGSVCVACMIIISYKKRRQIARRN